MLTKHNVCLFIKDEEHLEEMREFLESKGDKINQYSYYLSRENKWCNFMRYDGEAWELWIKSDLTEVTTEQFKKLWER